MYHKNLVQRIKSLISRRELKARLMRVGLVLSSIAVFCITYMLIAPVLTQEWPAVCGMEEHVHTDECYSLVLRPVEAETVEPTETEETVDIQPSHIHDDSCYTETTEMTLICEIEESEEHTHDESCYEETVVRELICTMEEPTETETTVEPSAEPKYEEVRVLTCGKEEHTHTDSCYTPPEEPTVQYLCGYDIEHTHDESCYFEDGQLKCTISEHTHTDVCVTGEFVMEEPTEEPSVEPTEEPVVSDSIFPDTLPEGYIEAEVFAPMAMFAMTDEEENGGFGTEALVYVPQDAFETPVMFVPQNIYDEDETQVIADALAEAGVEFDGMTALDLSFMNEDGEETEPMSGPVYVRLTLAQELPEEACPELYHMTENGVEAVAADVDYDAETQTLTMGFAVDSFSKFGITWTGYAAGGNTPAVTLDPYPTGTDYIPALVVYYAKETDTGIEIFDGKGKTSTATKLSDEMEYIAQNAPEGYEVDHYMVNADGQYTKVSADVVADPRNTWIADVNPVKSKVFNVFAILKENSDPNEIEFSKKDNNKVGVFINTSVQRLIDGHYTGEIYRDPKYWTSCISPDSDIDKNGNYFTYINDYANDAGIPKVYETVNEGVRYIIGNSDYSDTSVTSDLTSRQLGDEEGYLLENGTGTQVYKLETFPTDEIVFEWLRNSTDSAKNQIKDPVTDEPISAEELTPANYTIRWLSMKYNPQDYWHLDGVLVKREGHLTVSKTFYGKQEIIDSVKNGFYITVAEAKYDTDGKIIIDEQQEEPAYKLYLNRVEARNAKGEYTEVADSAPTQTSNADGSITYTWYLDTSNLTYHIMERSYTYNDTTVATVTEYRFSNLDAADSGSKPQIWTYFPNDPGLTLTGRTYAPETTNADWQRIHFRNGYLPANVLMLDTVANGEEPLSGVTFEVSKGDEKQKLYLMDGVYYLYRPQVDGKTITECDTATVSAEGTLIFGGVGEKETDGTYLLTETARPIGYSEARLQFTVGVVESGGKIEQNETDKAASFGVLGEIESVGTLGNIYTVTLNHTVEKAEINAKKVWSDGKDHGETVTLTLKNGATTISTLTLDKSNGWSGSFGEFPVYDQNGKIEYTVSETVTDGGKDVTDSYVAVVARQDTTDGNGKTTAISLTVTNSQSDNVGTFTFTKVAEGGTTKPLAGAVFELYQDEGCTISLGRMTSGEDGIVTSALLPVGTYYLKEIKAPEGYVLSGVTYVVEMKGKDGFTIKANGTDTDSMMRLDTSTKTYYIFNKSAYVAELPATGGMGTTIWYITGFAIMLAAAAILLYNGFNRRGEGKQKQ